MYPEDRAYYQALQREDDRKAAERKGVSDEVYRRYKSLKTASFMPEEVWMSWSSRPGSLYKYHKKLAHARASLRQGELKSQKVMTGNIYRRGCCKWELHEVWVDGVEVHNA